MGPSIEKDVPPALAKPFAAPHIAVAIENLPASTARFGNISQFKLAHPLLDTLAGRQAHSAAKIAGRREYRTIVDAASLAVGPPPPKFAVRGFAAARELVLAEAAPDRSSRRCAAKAAWNDFKASPYLPV